MIEFIIKEEKAYTKVVEKIIEQVMMKTDDEYEISEEMSKDTQYKIYIFEYNKESKKIIQEIRKRDWASMIIVTTDTEKKVRDIITLRIMPVDIIIKDRDYEKYLCYAISNSLRNIKERKDILSFEYKNVVYNIPMHTILYIEKAKEENKCLIHTNEKDYLIQGNIAEIAKKTSYKYIKCSRSHLINIEQVISYNKKENIITFANKEIFQNVSRNFKKEIISHLRKVE